MPAPSIDPTRLERLRKALIELESTYRSQEALEADPILIPAGFPDPMDREVAAWVAAHLAYGRVMPMMKAIQAGLAPLGHQPAHWLREHAPHEAADLLRQALSGWVWRFHTADDLVHWMLAWKHLDAESGGMGLEPHLKPGPGEGLDQALSRLIQSLRAFLPPTRGLRFSLPDPAEGAACKRWRMFLRWMVRPDWPDFGAWTSLDPADLVIPLDTHVGRISTRLGLTSRKTPDALMAFQITDALRQLDPTDPLRFDFALAHLGILGDCPGNKDLTFCHPCPLKDLCTCP